MEKNFPEWARIMRVGTWSLSHKDLTLTAEQADDLN